MALVSVAYAKRHLQIVSALSDDEVAEKLAEAEALIVGYLKGQADAAWTEDTAPKQVVAAILVALKSLFDDRERNEMIALLDQDGGIRSPIANLLRRDRDPALA